MCLGAKSSLSALQGFLSTEVGVSVVGRGGGGGERGGEGGVEGVWVGRRRSINFVGDRGVSGSLQYVPTD